jgi:N-acyl homoserine lactone hydrolase
MAHVAKRRPRRDAGPMSQIRVHAVETGRLVGNETFLRAEGWSSLLRRRRDYGFPVFSFVIEHPDGPIAIDTGMSTRARSPRPLLQRRFVPDPISCSDVGPGMRALGLDPADVRRVVLTHLDWDHAGGLAHFPHAEVLLHRPEYEFAATRAGRWRYEPRLWPPGFVPTVFDLDPEPYGPFQSSMTLTDDGAVRVVPLPGHSIGQVGVIVRIGEVRLFLVADHVLRQDWFLDDYAAGRLLGLGVFHARQARETSRRVHELMETVPTVLVPSHDTEVPTRLRAMEPVEVLSSVSRRGAGPGQ